MREDTGAEDEDREAEALLRGIAEGNRAARERLFALYRPRLHRMVRAKLGRRTGAQSDPSDIVQKAMTVAVGRLDDYILKRPMPLFPWLYVLTRDQMSKGRQRRPPAVSIGLSDESAVGIADRLADSGTSPSGEAIRNESRHAVRASIEHLHPDHREVLLMRYEKGLRFAEIAAILGIGESAAKMRHLRALEGLRGALGERVRETSG
jgi:RNA polymerase sigma-70 factor, ECF subfamily